MNGILPIRIESIKKEYLWGEEDWLLSYQHEGFEKIPLLIKKITARDALSVQVHPDDVYAGKNEGCRGKTEMWYILDCEPGAFLYYGLKQKISANEFLKRIHNGSITEVCRKITVKKGDVFYIPAGLLHAIGKGITLAEIQQSSNITYRVYDYQRRDKDNQLRKLHISQAAAVAGFLPPLQGHRPMGMPVRKDGFIKTLLVQCPHFIVHRYEVVKVCPLMIPDRFSVLYVTEGSGILQTQENVMELHNGDCIYLPPQTGRCTISGTIEFLTSEVPS